MIFFKQRIISQKIALFTFLLLAISAFPCNSIFAAPDDNMVWTQHNDGISGSSIVGVAINSSDTDTVYALTTNSGVYKTTDGGDSWTAANSGLPDSKTVGSAHLYGNLLTMDPHNSSVLYANFGGKIFKTTNGASSWNESNSGIEVCAPNYAIAGVIVDPTDSNHLLAGHTVSGCLGGIFESTNEGSSWSRITTTGPINNDAWPLAIDPGNSQHLYVAPVYLSFLYSTDGGSTWIRNVPTGASNAGQALAVHPTTHTRIFYGDSTGLYISSDSGLSWTSLTSQVPGTVYDIKFAETDSNLGYIASTEGIFKTLNGGTSWSEIGSHGDLTPRTLAIDPTDYNTIYLGSSASGMYKSSDGGNTFAEINDGIPVSLDVSSLAIAPSNHDVYYAALYGLGFFRSDDRGYTWREVSSSYTQVNNTNYILIDPTDEDTLYAGFGATYKSTDGGETFTLVNDPAGDQSQYFQAAAIDPENPSHLIIADNHTLVTYQSLDAGNTWDPIASFNPNSYIMNIQFDPTNSNNVYAATYDYFWKSTDNGDSWTRIIDGFTAGFDHQVDALAIDPAHPTTLYIGTRSDHVLKSIDSGVSWTTTGYVSDTGGATPNWLITDSSGNVYAFNFYGWEQSTDGGATWETQSTEGLDSSFFLFNFTARIDPDDETRFITGDYFDGVNIFENYVPNFNNSDADAVDDNGGSRIEGDTVTYTVTIENTGIAPGTDVTFSVTIPSGGEFISDSAKINGTIISDPLSGSDLVFPLGTILPNASVEVSYKFIANASLSSHTGTITSEEDTEGTDVSLPAFSVTAASHGGGGGGGGSSHRRPRMASSANSASTTSGTSTPVVSPNTINVATTTPLILIPFTRDLKRGDVGSDVKQLQMVLNLEGVPVAQTGPGSSGNETEFFGILTQKALTMYQNLHINQILFPAGLPVGGGTGYFGSRTRNHITTTPLHTHNR